MCELQIHRLPGWLSGKEFTCKAGHLGLIPGLGRSPGVGNGSPLQYCLKSPLDRRARQATLQRVAKNRTGLSTHKYKVHGSPSIPAWRKEKIKTNTTCIWFFHSLSVVFSFSSNFSPAGSRSFLGIVLPPSEHVTIRGYLSLLFRPLAYCFLSCFVIQW